MTTPARSYLVREYRAAVAEVLKRVPLEARNAAWDKAEDAVVEELRRRLWRGETEPLSRKELVLFMTGVLLEELDPAGLGVH